MKIFGILTEHEVEIVKMYSLAIAAVLIVLAVVIDGWSRKIGLFCRIESIAMYVAYFWYSGPWHRCRP